MTYYIDFVNILLIFTNLENCSRSCTGEKEVNRKGAQRIAKVAQFVHAVKNLVALWPRSGHPSNFVKPKIERSCLLFAVVWE